MKPKKERDKGSFLEYLANILWKIFKKIGELLVKLLKRVWKEIW